MTKCPIAKVSVYFYKTKTLSVHFDRTQPQLCRNMFYSGGISGDECSGFFIRLPPHHPPVSWLPRAICVR